MTTAASYKLGATRGIGSSTRMYGNCVQNTSQPSVCIDQFITILNAQPPFPSAGNNKIIFLLELTGGFIEGDSSVLATVQYYWNNYPKEYPRCPYLDTEGSIEKTLQLLDQCYSAGFRRIVGFSRSTVLVAVLPWFNLHPDVVGISPTSTAPSLNVPKSIFRITPNDHFMIDSIRPYLENQIVNYIYEANEFAAEDLITYIEEIEGITLRLYPIENTDDLNALSVFNTGHAGEVMLNYLITNRQPYLDLFKNSSGVLTYTNKQYDILGIALPAITDSTPLLNKYNTSNYKGTETSPTWRNGFLSLTSENYSIVSMNILLVLKYLVNNISLDNINSHFGILQFDPSTRDILFCKYLIETYTANDTFTSTSLFIVDPDFGQYTATFSNPAPVISFIPTPPYKPYGRAVALLELTNYSNNIDTIYKESLYYYWYKNPAFPKFPILDTQSSVNNTINLLNSTYAQGVRVYLGFSRSTMLTAVISWFDTHPDAVGISLWSTAISLNTVPRNIYRMIPSDDTLLNAILPYLPASTSGNVYYIYTDGEVATEDVLSKLEADTDLNVLTYAVNSTNTLTVGNLQTFFTGATSSDVVVLYLFDNQVYYDLYNASPTPLTFPGDQYDIVNTQFPVISGSAQTTLNNKLFYVQNTYPNTALLPRENTDYLTAKNNGEITTSAGLANALAMITNFQRGQNVELLPSYSAVLEFNEYKDIQYPTFLLRKYVAAENAFVQSSISFDDPLLGSFTASFD